MLQCTSPARKLNSLEITDALGSGLSVSTVLPYAKTVTEQKPGK